MQVTMQPVGIGSILALLVIIFAVLMALSVVPMNPISVGAMLAALGIARWC